MVKTRSSKSKKPTAKKASKSKNGATSVKNENETKPTSKDAAAFIAGVSPESKRQNAETLLKFFNRVTGLKPKMWGQTMIGYGRYHYKYDSGREGDYMMTGFSPRKQNLSVYVMPGYQFDSMKEKLDRLGKHKLGKCCLYINKLEDVDLDVLEEIVREGLAYMREKYETWNE
mmetsp:Transcript_29021/g.43847  ORF Transcript_29021/g.43847 Transcript_29021/m.43847 type:complete len:172 (+) Transcript_29021:297-812(+)